MIEMFPSKKLKLLILRSGLYYRTQFSSDAAKCYHFEDVNQYKVVNINELVQVKFKMCFFTIYIKQFLSLKIHYAKKWTCFFEYYVRGYWFFLSVFLLILFIKYSVWICPTIAAIIIFAMFMRINHFTIFPVPFRMYSPSWIWDSDIFLQLFLFYTMIAVFWTAQLIIHLN